MIPNKSGRAYEHEMGSLRQSAPAPAPVHLGRVVPKETTVTDCLCTANHRSPRVLTPGGEPVQRIPPFKRGSGGLAGELGAGQQALGYRAVGAQVAEQFTGLGVIKENAVT